MNTGVPDYYRHLVQSPEPEDAPEASVAPEPSPAPVRPFRADRFALRLPEGWHDETIYTFAGPAAAAGPVVTVAVAPDVAIATLRDFADDRRQLVERRLRSCRVLSDEEIALDDGTAAVRVVFSWFPADRLRCYREQVCVLHARTGYELNVTYPRPAWRTGREIVAGFLRSFRPVEPAVPEETAPPTPDEPRPPVPVPELNVRFEQADGTSVTRHFATSFSIGRGEGCEVQLDDARVSHVQAQVIYEGGAWQVYDTGSLSGLYVFGRRVNRVVLNKPTALWLGSAGPVVHLVVTDRVVLSPPSEATDGHPAAPVASPAPPVDADGSPGYRGDRFTLELPGGWEDRTFFIFGGPVSYGLKHTLTVYVDPKAVVTTLEAAVKGHLQALDARLTRCRILRRDDVPLDDGRQAYRVIFAWYPDDGRELYQEQCYVLAAGASYLMTATFASATFETLRREAEHIMRSLTVRG